VQYVLAPWTKEENDALPERLSLMGEAIQSFATIGLERTMNFFNNK
jgi:PTH1 family peptidyl-tRNA hydrolase